MSDKIKELESLINNLEARLEHQESKTRSKLDYLLKKIHILEGSAEKGDEFNKLENDD